MINILGLMTCYNRKEKTLTALNRLIQGNQEVSFSFVIADDGSTDGTFDELQKFPKVTIIRGDGNLFYSGGMRLAIAEAKKKNRITIVCMAAVLLAAWNLASRLTKKHLEKQKNKKRLNSKIF